MLAQLSLCIDCQAGERILLSIESLLSNDMAFSIHCISIIGHRNNAAATNRKSKESGERMLLTIESVLSIGTAFNIQGTAFNVRCAMPYRD